MSPGTIDNHTVTNLFFALIFALYSPITGVALSCNPQYSQNGLEITIARSAVFFPNK
jgi:hypothetical protein